MPASNKGTARQDVIGGRDDQFASELSTQHSALSTTQHSALGTSPLRTIEWIGDIDGFVRLIDQTLMPTRLEMRDCHSVEEVWEAIRNLRVRCAPAIGIAAALGVAVGMRRCAAATPNACERRLEEISAYLRTSRPTAVNLFWALDRMERCARSLTAPFSPARLREALL